jgi:hypothetical protein
MAWHYDPEGMAAILEEAGYETVVYDIVEGIREDEAASTNEQVYINPDGKLRYQYSRLMSQNSSTEHLGGKELSVDRQNRNIVNILGGLASTEELVALLKQLPVIAGKDDDHDH